MPVTMAKLEQQAPELVDMRKKVNISLEKAGLADRTAKVALVIDHSGSMQGMYDDGTVQAVAEKVLVLASAWDDDGDIDMFSFHETARKLDSLDLSNYQGGVDRLFKRELWGGTDYAEAIEAVRDHYREEASKFPAYVLFVTDGETSNRDRATAQLKASAPEYIFWQFIGISEIGGRESFSYLKGLKLSHVSFLKVDVRQVSVVPPGPQPKHSRLGRHRAAAPVQTTELTIPDDQLFDKLVGDYGRWLSMSR